MLWTRGQQTCHLYILYEHISSKVDVSIQGCPHWRRLPVHLQAYCHPPNPCYEWCVEGRPHHWENFPVSFRTVVWFLLCPLRVLIKKPATLRSELSIVVAKWVKWGSESLKLPTILLITISHLLLHPSCLLLRLNENPTPFDLTNETSEFMLLLSLFKSRKLIQ